MNNVINNKKLLKVVSFILFFVYISQIFASEIELEGKVLSFGKNRTLSPENSNNEVLCNKNIKKCKCKEGTSVKSKKESFKERRLKRKIERKNKRKEKILNKKKENKPKRNIFKKIAIAVPVVASVVGFICGILVRIGMEGIQINH